MSRLETMVLSGAELPMAVIRQQIASALDIVVQLSRYRDASRRVAEICEVVGVNNGEVELRTLYRFEEDGEENGRIVGSLRRVAELKNSDKLRQAGLAREAAC